VTHQALVPPFADDLPYAVAVVELAEGPRLVTAVASPGCAAHRASGGGPHRAGVDAIGLHYFVPRA
jgi:hypothetical protein